MRNVIFEGKVIIAGQLVDFRIYKHKEEGLEYYSYAINSWLRDKNQMSFHVGETLRGRTLDELFYRFRNVYTKEFTQIEEKKTNLDF